MGSKLEKERPLIHIGSLSCSIAVPPSAIFLNECCSTERKLSLIAKFINEFIYICIFLEMRVLLVEAVDGEEEEGGAVACQCCNFCDLREVHT